MTGNRGLLIVSMAIAVVLTACSGEEEPAANASATAVSAATVAAKSAAPAGTAAGGSAGIAAMAGFCGDWGTALAQSARLTAPSGTATSMKESVEAANTYLKTLSTSAPADVRADVQVFGKFMADFSAALARVNYDMTKIGTDPELQKALQAMNDPQLQQAGTNITAWIQKNCTAGR